MKKENFQFMAKTFAPSVGYLESERILRKPLVLIIEDHEPSCDLLRTIFRLKGCVVIEAELQHVIKVAEKALPNLILLNIGRPFHEGLEMIRRLRQHEVLHRLPTIITSGNASLDFRQEVVAAGYEEFLVKPIDFDMLERLLERHLTPYQLDALGH